MKSYIIVFLLFLIYDISYCQPWNYNYGSGSSTSFTTSNTVSEDFLPQPTSGEDRVRVSNGQGGGFYLDNPGLSGFGGDTELRCVASTGGSVNKFSAYDYSGDKAFTIKFTVRFGDASGNNTVTSGRWYFFQGNGSYFSNNSGFSTSQVFTGLEWVFGPSAGSISTYYRNGNSWSSLSGTPFSQGSNYTVEIYGNNSNSSISYTYGSSQTVAANKWDLWVNGTLIGDDLSKALLTDDSNIDSYMFYGVNSDGNSANIFIEDIFYTNEIADNPLPIELTSFTSSITDNSVQLTWSTAGELNNSGFDVERKKTELNNWQKIGFVEGHGTTNTPQNYAFSDRFLSTCKYNYRLKQIDFNGNYQYYYLGSEVSIGVPKKFELSQNFPNPFNPVTKISYELPNDSKVSIKIFDMLGREVGTLVDEFKAAGYYTVDFDGNTLSSGMYFYRIKTDEFEGIKKMLLIK